MSHDQQTAGGYSSHSHSDRVAERDPCNCAAYGCPMLGAMTNSTLGTSEWFCFLHFDKEATQWQAITAELHRLGWLVDLLRSLRTGIDFEKARSNALACMKQNGSTDLQRLAGESRNAWMRRLEAVLDNSCREAAKEVPVKQARMAQADTWSKVGFDLPETA
jgi:hypothetical protein